ncbi:hypothetical protein ACIQMZ_37130 [Streptomyces longwoodensis]|uniref:hypothetical protein n=1 Tax=Streptomyces longwoodensis TaxID=68231 RepID=UPI0037FAC496
MPDFVGGNVKGALMQLGPEADVRVTDSSGQDRSIDDEGDWKICTHQPSPGFLLNGHVIVQERCPYGWKTVNVGGTGR